ncbi:MAG: sensor histidine kinase, partial [Waterburya sp.]
QIQKAVQRISAQIEGMLELHRAKHVEIKLQTVDLSLIASEILTDLQASAPERSVEVAIAESITAYGDPVLLQVVLENLLSNAWKYSAKIFHSRIEFGYLKNSAVFYIQDNGAGFDMKQADDLFLPFKRLHSSQEFVGNGIGLASVARIIARHSGKIWAKSSPNQGATFFFTLPTVAA